jgi:hypothetical protein
VITAFDEVPNESKFSNVVSATTKLDAHGPQINHPVPDFSIDEDTSDSSKINLFSWFSDVNNDPLTFRYEDGTHFNVTINQQTGYVTLIPDKNWHGSETLVFFATDGLFECFDEIKITVNPVNDPPGTPQIIEPLDSIEIDFGILLNFTGNCTDPDLPEDMLTFNWISNRQGELGIGNNLTNIELIPGTHQITLMVTDKAGVNSSANITLTVLEKMEKTEEKNDIQLLSIIFGMVLIIIIILIIILVFKQRREKEKRIGQKASRFSFLTIRLSESTEDANEAEKSKITGGSKTTSEKSEGKNETK